MSVYLCPPHHSPLEPIMIYTVVVDSLLVRNLCFWVLWELWKGQLCACPTGLIVYSVVFHVSLVQLVELVHLDLYEPP